MKKLTITILAVLFMLALSTAAFAYGPPGEATTLGGTSTTSFTPSNNVAIGYTAGAVGISYSSGAYHTSGNRTFGTSSGDTKIYYQSNTAVAVPAAPPAVGSTADFSGWTAQ